MDAANQVDFKSTLSEILNGDKLFPGRGQDDSPFLSALRYYRAVVDDQKGIFHQAMLALVDDFCMVGFGDSAYADALFRLAGDLEDPAIIERLGIFAMSFAERSGHSVKLRQLVLSILVDSSFKMSVDFWIDTFERDSRNHAGMVFAALLSIDRTRAVALIGLMPNDSVVGHGVALNLMLACDDIAPGARHKFVDSVRAILPNAPKRFANPVMKWAETM